MTAEKCTRQFADLQPHDCPKFQRCNAPICPIDVNVGTHLRGEAICFYLREFVKKGARARFRVVPHGATLYRRMSEAYPLVSAYGDIRIRLQRARNSVPRLGLKVGKKQIRDCAV